jgi:hypothetical protein
MIPPSFRSLAVLFGLSILVQGMVARTGGDSRQLNTVAAPTGTPVRTFLNINTISTVVKNTGILDIDVAEVNSGLVYPKGSFKHAVFESGFLWGGRSNGEIRVGGSAYREGMQPGKIISPGVAESPDLPKNRIYRVRPDERPGPLYDADLSSEVADEVGPVDMIRARYETDWTEWPVDDGAPYTDVDSDGNYDPNVDIPGAAGADQTIWYVANDLNSVWTNNLYGSEPVGIEMQVTIWAYADSGILGRAFFRRYLLINKSADPFDSMYVSAWSDPDLGTSTNDFVGCDTTLQLGYCYNADDTDAVYSPLPPPAVGFALLQGPLADSPGDTGVFNGYRISDHRNLPMTAFYYFTRGDSVVTDPTQGSYEGTLQFYNFFRGRVGQTGELFIDPNTSQPTSFALAGDPVTGEGWVDGQRDSAGDRRLGLSMGPFTMASGDTQEVIIAEILSGAVPGIDRWEAVNLVRLAAAQIGAFFDSTFVITAVRREHAGVPVGFSLSQNFPNPFNAVTTLKYSLPVRSAVRLQVFDVLGRQVALLENDIQAAGTHVARWDASSYPSGVYYCRITSGMFGETRRMLLMR